MNTIRIFFFVALGLLGCGGPTRSDRGGFADGVIGGKAALAGDLVATFTVAIRERGNRHHLPECSGVLIRPNLVLTAAHCLSDERGPIPKSKIEVAFGPDGRTTDANLVRGIREFRSAPGFLNLSNPCPFGDCAPGDLYANFNPADVAVIRLAAAAPDFARPAAIAHLGFTWPSDRAAFVAGYGENVPREEKDADPAKAAQQTGTLRWLARQTFVKIHDEEVRSADHKIYVDADLHESLCHGDSGGPLYFVDEGQALVVGVSSHLANSDLDYPCANRLSAFTDVSAYATWIDGIVSLWGTP